MENYLIITGHGRIAEGIKSFMELVAGELQNFDVINFLPEDSTDDLRMKYHDIIEKNKDKNILFACDIVGGSPFIESVKCACGYPNVKVLGGFSPAGILAGYLSLKYGTMEELVETIVSSTRDNCTAFALDGSGGITCEDVDGI